MRELAGIKGGGGARSWRRQSLVLYLSLDTLWLQANNTCMAGLKNSAGITGYSNPQNTMNRTLVTVMSYRWGVMICCTCLKCALQTRRPQLYLTCAQIFRKVLHFCTINIWIKVNKASQVQSYRSTVFLCFIMVRICWANKKFVLTFCQGVEWGREDNLLWHRRRLFPAPNMQQHHLAS